MNWKFKFIILFTPEVDLRPDEAINVTYEAEILEHQEFNFLKSMKVELWQIGLLGNFKFVLFLKADETRISCAR